MSLSASSASAAIQQRSTPDARLSGWWLRLMRGLWGLVALIDLAVLIVGLPSSIAQLNTFCTDSTRVSCGYFQLSLAQGAALRQYGLSLTGYAIYAFVLDVVVSLLYIVVGCLIFWHRSADRMGLFVSLLLITFGSFGPDLAHTGALNGDSFVAVAAFPLVLLQWPALVFLFYTFPDGRFVPRWSWALGFLFVIQFGFYVLPYPYNYQNWPPLATICQDLVVYGSAIGVLVYRYLAVASALQRQQIKWLAFGFAWSFLTLSVLYSLLPVLFPALTRPSSWYQLISPTTEFLAYLIIPLGIGMALLRYRLWEIDTLINKALVYGVLSALLAAVYAGLIIGLEGLASLMTGGATDEPVALVISTLAIAALFLPLRQRIQVFIDRRFYRRKYDAEKTLAAFSAALRNEVDLHQVREQLLSVVQETMQPAHVSLWLRTPPRPTEATTQLPSERG